MTIFSCNWAEIRKEFFSLQVLHGVCCFYLHVSSTHLISLLVMKMLDPPQSLDLSDEEYGLVKQALALISDEQLHAAQAILSIVNDSKNGPSGHNLIQHPPPTISQGISNVKNSSLDVINKAVLIATLDEIKKSLNLKTLFLPKNKETKNRLKKAIKIRLAQL